MKTRRGIIVIQRLDERRYALAVDGIVRYVGTEEECQRRLAVLSPKNCAPIRTKPWHDYGGSCSDH